MDSIDEYSEAELKLIEAVSPAWLAILKQSYVNPPNLWNILATEVFISGKTGPEIEALRRVCKACRDCTIYRKTPEFDKLCEF